MNGDWEVLRKGKTNLYLEYAHTHTSNLYAEATSVRVSSRVVELRLDLNCNLRTKYPKSDTSYLEACDLAEKLPRLKVLQLSDDLIWNRLGDLLPQHAPAGAPWILTLLLKDSSSTFRSSLRK